MSTCAPFTTDDWDPRETWMSMMRCPNCKGWLPRDWPIGTQFLCMKCGAVLETLPSIPDTWINKDGVEITDEEDTDLEFGGRLCVVPTVAIKISTELPPKRVRLRKDKTNFRAIGRIWVRRVWEDDEGRFIEIGNERLLLTDPRILKLEEDLE